MDGLTRFSVTKLAALIRARRVSPVEVMEAYLRRVEQWNPELNAVVTLAADAIDSAREAEAAMMQCKKLGSLHGVPLTVKDTIETRGLRTTFGSRLRKDYLPARDAPAVALLRRAGGIIFGKTNVSEFAMALNADNPVFGRTNNPHDLTRTPGGSSGGEAAAISAGLSPAGLGSDLAGSIRVPAHCCGIVGLKPTSNRVPGGGHLPPLAGIFTLGASLGPLARSVEDLALIHYALTAFDPSEKMFVPTASGPVWRRQNLKGVRVGWYTNDGTVPVTEETKRAVESAAHALGEAGLVPEEMRPPGIERGPSLWFSLFAHAATDFLRAMYDGREAEAGPVVRAMLESGNERGDSSAPESDAVVMERESVRNSLVEWMTTTPLIVAPIGAVPAFKHGTQKLEIEGVSVGTFRVFGYSQTFNVYGFPSVCVPAGRAEDGMPIGVQIVGRPFAENAVLSAARIVEEALGGWQPPPET
jgi:Asp-tRNA(Asn)/Glu-tRNA(Gln) amidotransferase A subunit family amidase